MDNNLIQVFNDEDDARLVIVAKWYTDYLHRIPSDSECREWLRRIKGKGNVYYAFLEFLKVASSDPTFKL